MHEPEKETKSTLLIYIKELEFYLENANQRIVRILSNCLHSVDKSPTGAQLMELERKNYDLYQQNIILSKNASAWQTQRDELSHESINLRAQIATNKIEADVRNACISALKEHIAKQHTDLIKAYKIISDLNSTVFCLAKVLKISKSQIFALKTVMLDHNGPKMFSFSSPNQNLVMCHNTQNLVNKEDDRVKELLKKQEIQCTNNQLDDVENAIENLKKNITNLHLLTASNFTK